MLDKFDSSKAVAALLGAVRSLPRSAAMAIAGCVVMALSALAAAFLVVPSPVNAQQASAMSPRAHMGVASCSGSTCHGRSIGDGTPVAQNEILRWQEESSPSGAHSRAYGVLREPRSRAFTRLRRSARGPS